MPLSLARWTEDESGRGVGAKRRRGWAPLKQYEPYFSNTHQYESEDDIVQTGVTPIITYDALGRAQRLHLPSGAYRRTEWTAWSSTTYDENDTILEPGNLWYAARAPTGPATAEEKRARSLTEAHAATPSVTHVDVLGRPFLSIAHNKQGAADQFIQTRTKLDIEGHTLEVKDPLERACQSYAYSISGRLLNDTNIDKGARWHLAAADGAPIRRWDDREQHFRTTYDELRRPTHLHHSVNAGPETLLQRHLYGEAAATPQTNNLRGRPIRLFDSSGVTITEDYDFKGNLRQSARRLARAYTTTVDWSGIASLTDPTAIDSAANALLEADIFTEGRHYDALNRPTSITAPDSSELRPTYNEANLLEAVDVRIRGAATWTGFVTNIDYDAKGQRTAIAYGNGTTSSYTYDPLTFRLKRLLTTRTSPANTLQNLFYTFDPVGNIVQIQDTAQQTVFFDNTVTDGSNQYVYDAIYRLIFANGREQTGLIADEQRDNRGLPLNTLPHANDSNAVRAYEEEYRYDTIGNIEQMIHRALGTSPPPGATWTRAYTYTSGTNRLESNTIPGGNATYGYADGHGNITSMPHLATIDYSPFDQMSHADLGGGGDAYYVYGADGQRVRKVVDTGANLVKERIYLGGFEIYREHVSGAVTLERQTLHVMDGVKRIAMVETKTVDAGAPPFTPTPRVRFQLGNHLGSALLEVDETGLVISYEEYHPYGTSAYRSSNGNVEVSARRYRYTGKERDEESGLYYHGARYYACWLARWTSADPMGIGADGPGLYSYVRGSPVGLSDPSGLEGQGNVTKSKTTFLDDPVNPQTVAAQQAARLGTRTRNNELGVALQNLAEMTPTSSPKFHPGAVFHADGTVLWPGTSYADNTDRNLKFAQDVTATVAIGAIVVATGGAAAGVATTAGLGTVATGAVAGASSSSVALGLTAAYEEREVSATEGVATVTAGAALGAGGAKLGDWIGQNSGRFSSWVNNRLSAGRNQVPGERGSDARPYISGFRELLTKARAAKRGDTGAAGELEVAKAIRDRGLNVHFQSPGGPGSAVRSSAGGTADLLVGGGTRNGGRRSCG